MENKYGIIRETKEELEFPVRELLKVPHQGKDLIVSYPAFGRNYFSENLKEMQKTYSHPDKEKGIKTMTFREATTSESISASAYEFKNLAKKEIFDPAYLQVGRIVRASEGVWINPLKDENGKSVLDEKILKDYLNKSEKVNGIYLFPNELVKGVRDFVFVPYETFEQKFYESGKFPETGLARGLEYTKDKVAKNLEEISKSYSEVEVFGFDSVSEPIEKIVALDRYWGFDGWLFVDGDGWDDDGEGLVFGVLSKLKKK